MDTDTAPNPVRPLDQQIPWDVYAQIASDFRDILPPPAEDTPDALDRRNRAAIGVVSSLVPVTAAEGKFAADYVICAEQAHDAFRVARAITDNPALQEKKLNWALRYLGKANACMAMLLRMQAERRRRDAAPNAAMHAYCCERSVLDYLAAGFGYPQPTEERARQPAPPPQYEEVPPPPLPPSERPNLTEGERYAVIYPDRARLIRSHGGMPGPPLDRFGPPPRRVINELLTSTSPHILALDAA